jgi:hypothetical protein
MILFDQMNCIVTRIYREGSQMTDVLPIMAYLYIPSLAGMKFLISLEIALSKTN